ncbi:MAG: type restriction enzyme subunit, partial [Candidatus Poribacteria bacterium]|nr:type restriction enzyme subunit [Candidatus Poribacteria bacterium]
MRESLPTSWNICKLKDVAEIITGTTPPKSNPDFYGGGIPFITPAELDCDPLVSASPTTLTEQGVNKSRILPKKAVMVSCIGSLGKVGLAGCPLVTNQQINSLIFDEDKIYFQFGYYFCKTLKPLLESLASSTTLPIINKSKFSEISIPLPPLPQQKRIAAILDQADNIRRKRQKAIQLANTFLLSVFWDMFGYPERFNLIELQELASKERYSLSSGPFGSNLTSAHYTDKGVIVLRGLNITEWGIDLINVKFISEEKAQSLIRSEVKPGDIVVVAVGASGLACQIPETLPRAIMSQNFNKISPNLDQILPTYLEYCINSNFVRRQLEQNITDTVRTFLSLTKLKTIKIPTPPLPLQKKFSNCVERIK